MENSKYDMFTEKKLPTDLKFTFFVLNFVIQSIISQNKN